jgi:hypothetical protein
MTPRTLTAPPTDRSMWRRLIRRVHPDHGGDQDLFIWTTALHEHVAGDHLEPVVDARSRRARYRDSSAGSSERVPFDRDADHEVLTDRVVTMADAVAEPYGYLLRAVADCYPAEDGPLYHQQLRGATYKQLAAIGYEVGMSKAERIHWYRIAETVPLSQRHAGHIISKLKRAAA